MVLLLILLAPAIVYGPFLWCSWVIRHHRKDRPDFPGTGGELARHLLDRAALDQVKVEIAGAQDGDHYDGGGKAVRLLREHYEGRSLSAVAIAAHEVGHAIQDRDDYGPLRARHNLVTSTYFIEKIGSAIMLAAPIVGMLSRSPGLIMVFVGIGVLTLAVQVVVHFVTLPVEYDASFNRALPILEHGGYLPEEDFPAARRILKAAALTYVAASLTTLLNLWRWIRILR